MSRSESNPDRLTRQIRGANSIAQAADAAREFATAQWLDEDELARLCVVVEELVANLYDHGGLTEGDCVELSFLIDPEGINVAITDPGKPFDPWSASRSVRKSERGGGAGIDIVRAWAQFIGYQSSAEGNRLEFLLPVRWDS